MNAYVIGWRTSDGATNGETVNTWAEAVRIMRRVVVNGGEVTEAREVVR
jgi:hypothetical protein